MTKSIRCWPVKLNGTCNEKNSVELQMNVARAKIEITIDTWLTTPKKEKEKNREVHRMLVKSQTRTDVTIVDSPIIPQGCKFLEGCT